MTPHLRKKMEEAADESAAKVVETCKLAQQTFGADYRYPDTLRPLVQVQFVKGFQAAHDLLMPEVEKLVEALKESRSAFSCIRHNCPIDPLLMALDIGQQIVVKHIDQSDLMARKALANWQWFVEGDIEK